jgi:hypothetical protein
MTPEVFYQTFLILFGLFLVAEVIFGIVNTRKYSDRTYQLFLSNEIRRQMYIEKYKPQIRATPPPNPWDNKEQITKDQLDQMSESLKKGRGIGAFFDRVKR